MAFKSLVSALSEQRQEIKQSLTLFPYFDTWDNKVIAECCQLSKIIEFPPDEIILGSGSINSHMTFFILEGVCKIIHHLLVRVKTDSYGRTSYSLYKPEETGNLSSQSNNVGYTSLLFNQKHDFQREEQVQVKHECNRRKSIVPDKVAEVKDTDPLETVDEKSGEEERLENETGGANTVLQSDVTEETEREGQQTENETIVGTTESSNDDYADEEAPSDVNPMKTVCDKQKTANNEENSNTSESGDEEERECLKQMQTSEEKSKVQEKNKNLQDPEPVSNEEVENLEKTFQPDHHLKVLEKCKAKSKQIVRLADEKILPEKPKDVKSFFVQVALFYKGACFGLDENMKDTFIMSATKVKCLRIPRRFLLQHNPCNIWNRIRLFFSLYIPPEKQILDYVKSDRNWNNMKRKKSEEIVSRKRIPNYILCSEVPFSIRLQDMPQ